MGADLSYHWARVSKDILAQEAESTDEWTQTLKDRNREDAVIVDDNIEIED